MDQKKCQTGCQQCKEACPTEALRQVDGQMQMDLGRCLFCTDCVQACPDGALRFSTDYRLATRTREALKLSDGPEEHRVLELARALEERSKRLFGHSLKLRQVSASGCKPGSLRLALRSIAFSATAPRPA